MGLWEELLPALASVVSSSTWASWYEPRASDNGEEEDEEERGLRTTPPDGLASKDEGPSGGKGGGGGVGMGQGCQAVRTSLWFVLRLCVPTRMRDMQSGRRGAMLATLLVQQRHQYLRYQSREGVARGRSPPVGQPDVQGRGMHMS